MTRQSVNEFHGLIMFLMFRDFFLGFEGGQTLRDEEALREKFPEEVSRIMLCWNPAEEIMYLDLMEKIT